jgi:hypothetical protein
MKQQKLKKWYEEICLKHLAHETAANISDKRHNIIGFTAIVAGIIAGTQVYDFASDNNTVLPMPVLIVLALFAIIAAIFNAATKFFGYETRKQRHKSTAAACAAVKYEMESLLLNEEKRITPDILSKIQKQLSDISKNSPLIKESMLEKARLKLSKETLTEIPSRFLYDMKLIERWKIEDLENWKVKKGSLIEIKSKPTRTYNCEPLELIEYPKSKRIFIKEQHIMDRDNKKITVIMEGDGIIDNNTGFITYSVSDVNFKTYGNMVLNFTNKISAKGLWMTANVKEANLLIGTVELNLKIEHKKDKKQSSHNLIKK